MENTPSGQGAKGSKETDSDPLAVVQLRDGCGLAQTGPTNLENSA